MRRLTLIFAAPRYQVIKNGVANPPAFGLENQMLFVAQTLIIEAFLSDQRYEEPLALFTVGHHCISSPHPCLLLGS